VTKFLDALALGTILTLLQKATMEMGPNKEARRARHASLTLRLALQTNQKCTPGASLFTP
jgi:hypothetical protein